MLFQPSPDTSLSVLGSLHFGGYGVVFEVCGGDVFPNKLDSNVRGSFSVVLDGFGVRDSEMLKLAFGDIRSNGSFTSSRMFLSIWSFGSLS